MISTPLGKILFKIGFLVLLLSVTAITVIAILTKFILRFTLRSNGVEQRGKDTLRDKKQEPFVDRSQVEDAEFWEKKTD